MLNLIKLNEKKIEVFKNAIATMANFKKVFNRDLNPAFIAELYAAEKLDLGINPAATERGFDALDSESKRYEIKYRRLDTQNVDANNFNFDYMILANLDDDYRLVGMWRINTDQARQIFLSRERFRKYQTTQAKFKSIAERIV